MSLIILNVDEVRRTLSASGGAFVVHDKEVDIVRFAINSGFADIVLDGQVALRVMYQRPGETEVKAQTLTYYDTDGAERSASGIQRRVRYGSCRPFTRMTVTKEMQK